MLKYKVKLPTRTVEVELLEKRGSQITFRYGENTYTTELQGSTRGGALNGAAPVASNTASQPAATQSDPNKVSSPMPGLVTKVLVENGANVSQGDTVVIIEAMKMENNIAAQIDGTVKEIMVSSGQEVGQGDVLLVLE